MEKVEEGTEKMICFAYQVGFRSKIADFTINLINPIRLFLAYDLILQSINTTYDVIP